MALAESATFAAEAPHDEPSEIDAPVTSPTLARLLEEVRGGDHEVTRAYNRTYNRHNR